MRRSRKENSTNFNAIKSIIRQVEKKFNEYKRSCLKYNTTLENFEHLNIQQARRQRNLLLFARKLGTRKLITKPEIF